MSEQSRHPHTGDTPGDRSAKMTRNQLKAGYDYSKSMGECPDSALEPDNTYRIKGIRKSETASDEPDFA